MEPCLVVTVRWHLKKKSTNITEITKKNNLCFYWNIILRTWPANHLALNSIDSLRGKSKKWSLRKLNPRNIEYLKSVNQKIRTSSVNKVKLAILVEDYPKAPFLIATTTKSMGRRYSIPWIAPLYPWLPLPYSTEC